MTPVVVDPDTELYLIRHGETDWNRTGRFQGQSDVPMNATGIGQAHRIGRRLSQLVTPQRANELDVVSSPLLRARQTADVVCQALGLDIGALRISDTLAELSFGEWEGLTTEEIKLAYPEHRRARKRDRWNVSAPGGESFGERIPELGLFLANIDRPTVLVCHAGVIRICLYLLGAVDRQSALISPISHDRIYVWSQGTLAAR